MRDRLGEAAMSETKELIERLRNGDAMNGRTVNCKLDQSNCAIMENAASLLASQAEEIERLKAQRDNASSNAQMLNEHCIRLTRERDEALEAMELVLTGGNHLANLLIGSLGARFSEGYPPG